MSWADREHTHKRRIGKGREALNLRRAGALDRLEKVEKPNERQLAEIEALRKRVSRGQDS